MAPAPTAQQTQHPQAGFPPALRFLQRSRCLIQERFQTRHKPVAKQKAIEKKDPFRR